MEKEIIKELNIVFKENGWKLLPENNEYPNSNRSWYVVIIDNRLHIDRNYIPYEKHTNKFTIQQLDNYVVEFIKNICLEYKIKQIVFNDTKNRELNSIILK